MTDDTEQPAAVLALWAPSLDRIRSAEPTLWARVIAADGTGPLLRIGGVPERPGAGTGAELRALLEDFVDGPGGARSVAFLLAGIDPAQVGSGWCRLLAELGQEWGPPVWPVLGRGSAGSLVLFQDRPVGAQSQDGERVVVAVGGLDPLHREPGFDPVDR